MDVVTVYVSDAVPTPADRLWLVRCQMKTHNQGKVKVIVLWAMQSQDGSLDAKCFKDVKFAYCLSVSHGFSPRISHQL